MQNNQSNKNDGGRSQPQYNNGNSNTSFSSSDQANINEKLKKQLELKTQEVLDLTGQVARLKTEGDIAYIMKQNHKLYQEKCKFQAELKNVKADHEAILSIILAENDTLRTEKERLSAVPAGSADAEELSRENNALKSKINSLYVENFELIGIAGSSVIIDHENTDLRERLKFLDTENTELKERSKTLDPSEAKKKKYDDFSKDQTDKLPEIDELTDLHRKLERQEEAHEQELRKLREENGKLLGENQSLMLIIQENINSINSNEANNDALLAKTIAENERLKDDLRKLAFSIPIKESLAANNLGQQNDQVRKELEQEVVKLRERQAYFDSLLECDSNTKDALLILHTAEIEKLKKERDELFDKSAQRARVVNNRLNSQNINGRQVFNNIISYFSKYNRQISELEVENFHLKIELKIRAKIGVQSNEEDLESLTQSVLAELIKEKEIIQRTKELQNKQERIENLEADLSDLREVLEQFFTQQEELEISTTVTGSLVNTPSSSNRRQ